MKILYVTTCYPSVENPQYCIFLEQQAQAFKRLGNIIDILYIKGVAREEAEAIDTIYRDGLKIYNLHLASVKTDLVMLNMLAKRQLRLFDWLEYDAVVMHFGSINMLKEIVKCCKRSGIPAIMVYHGLNVWKDYYYKKDLLHLLYQKYTIILKKNLLNKVDGIIGVSNQTCMEVRKKLPARCVHTVYNGVDVDRVLRYSIEKVLYPHDDFCVLCVGNLIKIKGQEYLLRAIEQLRRESRNVRLVLIGDGSERAYLTNLCYELRIEQYVTFLGIQLYDDVLQNMGMCDMFILPSYFEAFGCVFVEAMCSGALTCGCKGTGAEEIIENAVSGLLIEQKSVSAIVEAVRFCMDNKEKAKVIADNGKKRAEEFSWDQSARSLQTVLTEIIHSSR